MSNLNVANPQPLDADDIEREIEAELLDLIEVCTNPSTLWRPVILESRDKLKQLLRRFGTELIGEDIARVKEVEGSSVAKYYVNKTKAEQHKKLNSLVGEE